MTEDVQPTPIKDKEEIEDVEITRDDVFHLLRNRRRRFALHYVKGAEGPVEIGEVAEQVAAWENDVALESVTSQQRKRVYNSLQQTHLPELHNADFIDYDERRGRITLTDRAADLDRYLELEDDGGLPWRAFFVALGGATGAAIVAARLGVAPFAAVPDIAWGALLSAVLTASALLALVAERLGGPTRDGEPPEIKGERW